MAQIIVSRELYADTPHEARRAADQQARVLDRAELLGLTHDYYPTVDMQAADLYIGGDAGMLEELLESIERSPDLRLSVEIQLREGESSERYDRFSFQMDVS